MDIHFLGTGSAYPSAIRDHTSICVTTNNYQFLIDVSGNPCKTLKQLHIDCCELDAILFTHFHIDHVYGLPALLWGMRLEKRTKPLTIFCDVHDEEKLTEWLQTIEVDHWDISFAIDIKTFQGDTHDDFFKIDDLAIACFPAIHSKPTVGFEINEKDKAVIYSGDSEVNPYISAYPFINLLIHEATTATEKVAYHTSLTQLADYYDFAAIEKVKLIHLSDGEDYERAIEKLDPKVAEKISLAEGLTRVEV